MQRAIKFRVFDKEAKTMHQVSCIDFENKEVFIYDKNLSFDEIELMQFTGLHDKNGKEIYDGDVVFSHRYKMKTLCKWTEEHACFAFIENGDAESYYFQKIDGNYLEIIGNIHENPDLLK